jgi:hypothetical protein
MARDSTVSPSEKIRAFLSRYGFLLFSLGYLALALKLLPDYGPVADTFKNLREGQINLDFLLKQEPLSFRDQIMLAQQIHGAFFFMIAEASKRLFSGVLGWFSPLAAPHVFLPFLTVFFLNIYDRFLKTKIGAWNAFVACALLLTYPHFWGYSFNNIKDLPLLFFFSIAIFAFYGWIESGRRKTFYLYAFCIAFGIAVLSKLYAVLALPILALWLVLLKLLPFSFRSEDAPDGPLPPAPPLRKSLLHLLAGLGIAGLLAAIFFMPAFFSLHDKWGFLNTKPDLMQGDIYSRYARTGNFYTWAQVFFITPCLTLLAAVWGFFRFLSAPLRKPWALLLLVWFVFIMSIFCSPLIPGHSGIRHFMMFLVPFSCFAALGIDQAAGGLERFLKGRKQALRVTLGLLVIAAQIWGLAETHPYESTFFNAFAGGLKGAQEKKIAWARDFWLTSYLEATSWINKNAPGNAVLFTSEKNGNNIAAYYPLRPDIRPSRYYAKDLPLPANSILFLSYKDRPEFYVSPVLGREDVEKETPPMKKVYDIKRQGGEILAIYYQP